MNAQFRYSSLLLTMLLFLVAGCGTKEVQDAQEKAPAGAGTKITGAELTELLSGNTISLSEYGEVAVIEMYANGKMYAVKSKTEKNEGKWSTEEDKLCLQFRRWGFGEELCYTVFRKGEEYNLYTDTGLKSSYFTITKGVKRGQTGKKQPAKRASATTSPDVVIEEPAAAPPVSTPAIQETNQAANPQAASRDLGMIYRGMSQNCPGCNLQGANLAEASLMRANLAGANLSNANMVKANLKWANLKGANLTAADLSGANLAGADLAGANLERADLTGTNLEQANLRGATITGAIGLDLKKAIR
ncbi:MAG TPA: pentapeptide repeat-containing protein [Desulfurivibrionaceae bacterium]